MPRKNQKTEEREGNGGKPDHYKVICVSLYTEDLEGLDKKVATLKERGNYKANRSALIRYALSLVDPKTVPKGALRLIASHVLASGGMCFLFAKLLRVSK